MVRYANKWILAGVIGASIYGNALSLDLSSTDLQNRLKPKQQSEEDNEKISIDVDSNTYIVGPGDGFQIHMQEFPSQVFNPIANATGNIFIGEFGEIPVARLPLIQAYGVIRQRIGASLKKKSPIYVTLNRLKTPNVSVTGSVSSSGTLQLKGSDRILDALKSANNGEIPDSGADLRQVRIRNGGSTKTVDLLLFLKTNDFSQNPYVYTGDEIQVPLINHTVTVGGQILWPQDHSLSVRNGESVSSILKILILKPNADTNFILVRHLSGSVEKVLVSDAENFALEDNDVIIIRAQRQLGNVDTAVVTGEVMRPGTIPIQSGKTTVAEALEMAGGTTLTGDLQEAYVLRREKMKNSNSEQNSKKSEKSLQTKVVPTTVVRPEISSSMENLLVSYDYAILPLKDGGSDVILEQGDEIHVPRHDRYVYLSGQVGRPGVYSFHPGWDVDDYVHQAGGYTQKADVKNSYVVTYYLEAYQIKNPKNLRSGDIIVIPTSVQYKEFTSVFLPTTQVVLSIFSLALSMLVLTGFQF